MAKFYTELNESLRQFIAAQRIYFNASAPNQGRINVSPKGLDTLRVLSDRCVGYLDLTASESETAAHLAENGRLTLMFCSFQDKPLILRLYGRGRVVRPQDAEWPELRPHFPPLPGERQIILLDIESIMTTCGFAVPLFEHKGDRSELLEFSCKMGDRRMEGEKRRRKKGDAARIKSDVISIRAVSPFFTPVRPRLVRLQARCPVSPQPVGRGDRRAHLQGAPAAQSGWRSVSFLERFASALLNQI